MDNNQFNQENNVVNNNFPEKPITSETTINNVLTQSQSTDNVSLSQPTIDNVTTNNTKQPLNKKLLIIIAAIVAVIITVVVICILVLPKNKENPKKENDNSELALKVLTDLKMDGFVASILTWETEVNKNLLDLSSEIGVGHYFAGNKEIEKYILIFPNPSNADMIYIKYKDFVNKSNEAFGKMPTYQYQGTTMNFPNLVKNAQGKYETTLDGVGVCDFAGNTDNCYVLVSAGYTVDNKSAEFSKLKMKGNKITGIAKKYFDNNDKDFYVDANFEMEVEKKANNYIVKNFVIKKINSQ